MLDRGNAFQTASVVFVHFVWSSVSSIVVHLISKRIYISRNRSQFASCTLQSSSSHVLSVSAVSFNQVKIQYNYRHTEKIQLLLELST
jgi:hypothetical protein